MRDSTDTVPLALLAGEWDMDVDTLAGQLGERVIIDDLEVRHVRRTDAAELLEQRRAQAQARAEAETAHRERLAALQRPILNRVAAIQAHQLAQRANGDIDSGTSALSAMRMADTDTRLTAAAGRLDELLHAGKQGHVGYLHRLEPTTPKG